MEQNNELIKEIREAYAKEEGYSSFASMASNVNIVPRDISVIAKRYAEAVNKDLSARSERMEQALKEIRYVHKSSDSSAVWQLQQVQNIAVQALEQQPAEPNIPHIEYNIEVPIARLKAEQFFDEEFARLTDIARRHEVSQEKETWIACYMAGYNAAQTIPQQGAVTMVFVPCEDDDPRCSGGYTSSDGQCLCHVRESKVPVVMSGSVWLSNQYEQLYDQLKADAETRIVCFVDHICRIGDTEYMYRDICTIWGETMEFASRGHGYGSVKFMPGDFKTNFIALCEEMHVQWLDEGGEKEME